MARRKRPSELEAQLSRRLASMGAFQRDRIVRRLTDDVLALKFFEGETIDQVSTFSTNWWPRTREHVEASIRNHVSRRDRREAK